MSLLDCYQSRPLIREEYIKTQARKLQVLIQDYAVYSDAHEMGYFEAKDETLGVEEKNKITLALAGKYEIQQSHVVAAINNVKNAYQKQLDHLIEKQLREKRKIVNTGKGMALVSSAYEKSESLSEKVSE